MSTLAEIPPVKHKREVLDQAVIRFRATRRRHADYRQPVHQYRALYGNDIATFPTIRRKFALLREQFLASAVSNSIFPRMKSTRPATQLTC